MSGNIREDNQIPEIDALNSVWSDKERRNTLGCNNRTAFIFLFPSLIQAAATAHHYFNWQ
jgi:hypothetical protein